MFVEGKKRMVLQCPLQPASRVRPYTPSAEQESDDFLKFMVERGIEEER